MQRNDERENDTMLINNVLPGLFQLPSIAASVLQRNMRYERCIPFERYCREISDEYVAARSINLDAAYNTNSDLIICLINMLMGVRRETII